MTRTEGILLVVLAALIAAVAAFTLWRSEPMSCRFMWEPGSGKQVQVCTSEESSGSSALADDTEETTDE